jgi:hypothetical protein
LINDDKGSGWGKDYISNLASHPINIESPYVAVDTIDLQGQVNAVDLEYLSRLSDLVKVKAKHASDDQQVPQTPLRPVERGVHYNLASCNNCNVKGRNVGVSLSRFTCRSSSTDMPVLTHNSGRIVATNQESLRELNSDRD